MTNTMQEKIILSPADLMCPNCEKQTELRAEQAGTNYIKIDGTGDEIDDPVAIGYGEWGTIDSSGDTIGIYCAFCGQDLPDAQADKIAAALYDIISRPATIYIVLEVITEEIESVVNDPRQYSTSSQADARVDERIMEFIDEPEGYAEFTILEVNPGQDYPGIYRTASAGQPEEMRT